MTGGTPAAASDHYQLGAVVNREFDFVAGSLRALTVVDADIHTDNSVLLTTSLPIASAFFLTLLCVVGCRGATRSPSTTRRTARSSKGAPATRARHRPA